MVTPRMVTDELVQRIRTAKFRQRFYAKIADAPGGCHVWTGAVSSNGRGMVGVAGGTYSVHRVAWMIQHGKPIPDGLTIDHLCYNGLCVNPDHLEAVEFAINLQRRDEHFGPGASLRVRCSKTGTPSYQVLWVERTDGKKTQRGRTFRNKADALALIALLRGDAEVA
ncbi:HNH endonuclease signature motif containing protein [Mycobacterium celatum]|uniref:HNH nuclease domain-containing protein n=1 Tax=Mycobacterium celatum TaxID=28045 RepID=A0A2G5PRE6_MYCCE|nr:HNH endonuclease signature motif containing protein [Mycobacterium celatum]PIB80524.1 hypothetical protein CQY23_03010 [Mycobacterium celatum]